MSRLRLILCALFHARAHTRKPVPGVATIQRCSCTRCGYAWMEHSR